MFVEDRLLARHRDAVASHAAALGVTIQSAEQIPLGQHGAGDQAKQILKMAVLGSAPTKPTSVDAYWIEGPVGSFLFAQPFQHSDALTGEYHLLLSGGLPQPVALCRASFFRKKWTTAEDRALLAALEASKPLAAAIKKLCWSKHTTFGEIDLDWTVQLSALGDGTSHLVVQAGSPALSMEDPLLGPFLEVAAALAPLLQADAPLQERYFEPQYEDLFFG
jgi:hypothetical protein